MLRANRLKDRNAPATNEPLTTESSNRLARGIPFVTSRWRLISLGLVALLLMTGSFVLGQFVKSPNEQALAHIDAKLPITAAVENRTVSNATRISSIVMAGSTTGIDVASVKGADLAVLTEVFVQPGALLEPGMALATVSGRPIFLTSNTVPLYRDLRMEDTGPDVRALEEEFAKWGYSIDGNGVVGETFASTMRSIYASVGVKPPGEDKVVFSRNEFAHLPAVGAVVMTVADVGSEITKENPIVTVKATPDRIVGRAGLSSGHRFKPGDPVEINFSGVVIDATVTSVSGFIEGDGTSPSGMDVSVLVPPDLRELNPGAVGTMTTKEPPISGLAVPLVGLRSDAEGEYVLVMKNLIERSESASAGAPATQRVACDIVGQAEGWVVVDPAADSDLVVGAEILVSP